jgi:hypothetical protein
MGDHDQIIANMRGRIEQCRRLAKSINDQPARAALLKMGDEIEVDMRRLEAERNANGAGKRPENTE